MVSFVLGVILFLFLISPTIIDIADNTTIIESIIKSIINIILSENKYNSNNIPSVITDIDNGRDL
jgi:hypothetical protein